MTPSPALPPFAAKLGTAVSRLVGGDATPRARPATDIAFPCAPRPSRFAGTPAGCHRLRHAGTHLRPATALDVHAFNVSFDRGDGNARRARSAIAARADRRAQPRTLLPRPTPGEAVARARAPCPVATRSLARLSERFLAPPPSFPRASRVFDPGRPARRILARPHPLTYPRPLAPPSSSGSREVQHREGHRRVHQEGVRQEVQPHLALHRRPQLRLLRHARDEALIYFYSVRSRCSSSSPVKSRAIG